jgi:hypothetical protein
MSVEENGTGRFSSQEDSTAQHRFDDLARGLASGALSRRRALRLLGGALVGSLMASFPGVAGATERNRDNDERCRNRLKTRCNGKCVNRRTNEKHCGSCGNRCRSNQTCCNGKCVNLQANERHCGRCFKRCQENETCVKGRCRRPEGQCRTANDCPQPTDQCQKAVCKSGRCTNEPDAGKACNDNNSCTTNDTCTATGDCVGTLRDNCLQCQTDAQCADVPVDQCFAAVCGTQGFCVVEIRAGDPCDSGNRCIERGTCTAAGTCDPGPVKTCPPSGNPCAERVCNPTTGDCELVPANAGAPCRQARGECEEDAVCTGTSIECPETFLGAGTVCREAAGPCDVEETCTGTSADCPSDRFRPSDFVCREPQNQCENAATCDGTSAMCPANPIRVGAACNDENPCTTDEVCLANGTCRGNQPQGTIVCGNICCSGTGQQRICCIGVNNQVRCAANENQCRRT